MFGLKRGSEPEPTGQASAQAPEAGTGKGRPTPSRREAQERRKQQLKSPMSPKASRKEEREQQRAARQRAREGMLAGDERYMPARDRGPAKAFARDFVDSRTTLAEFFIFVAIAILVLGFIPVPAITSVLTLSFFVFTALMAVDTIIILIRLNLQARKKFPDPKERKGIALYAALRCLQLRRLRLPPPRLRRGGRPVT